MIINPLTNRKIKIGGNMYKTLIKSGTIQPDNDEMEYVQGVLESNFSDEDSDYIEMRKKKLNKKLPANKQAVRGRGVKKNNLVIRTVPLLNQQTAKRMKKKKQDIDDLEIMKMIMAEYDDIKISDVDSNTSSESESDPSPPKREKTATKKFVDVSEGSEDDDEDESESESEPEDESEEMDESVDDSVLYF